MPNLLTGLRLVLAVVFFVMLAFYQYDGRGDPKLLNFAFVVYLAALITDYLDGYLARKWKVEGAFGRVVDPFVDKVLVLGSFAFFAGKNFIIPDTVPRDLAGDLTSHAFVVKTITGVAPAMVVVLLARELLVTTFRGMSESAGQNFGAAFSGKLKMVVQSVTILVILVYVNYRPWLARISTDHDYLQYATYFRDLCIYVTLAVTVFSAATYLRKAAAMYSQSSGRPAHAAPAEKRP